MELNMSYDSFRFQHTLYSIFEASHHAPFHPLREPKLHWIHETFI